MVSQDEDVKVSNVQLTGQEVFFRLIRVWLSCLHRPDVREKKRTGSERFGLHPAAVLVCNGGKQLGNSEIGTQPDVD
jgi:hypothetical protein